MAATLLGSKAAGAIVNFRVNGALRDFLVVHQGKPSAMYDDSFNSGTILLMKDVYESRVWHSANTNDYANSTIHSYLNSTFLNLIEANIRSLIKQVKIPYRPGSAASTNVNSGANGLPASIFLLSIPEVDLAGTTSAPNDGATVDYFAGGGASRRIAYLNSTASGWWLRSPLTTGSAGTWYVSTSGTANSRGGSTADGVRPALVLPSSLWVSDTGEITTNLPPTAPPSIVVPGTAVSTQQVNVSWAASTDPEGDTVTYILERAYNSGSFTQVASTAGLTFSETVLTTWNTIQYRVKARDASGSESNFTTSNTISVIHNQPPVISGEDGDLGIKTEAFTFAYTVTDADGDTVTVTECVGETQIRSFTAVLGVQNTASVSGDVFLDLSFDTHTLVIVATDTSGNTTLRQMTFTKQVDGLTVELAEPMEATAQPRRVNIAITRSIPAGATFMVEATNNAFDATPVWEDCTRAVLSSLAHVFNNTINTSPQFGMNIRVTVKRKRAVGECWVSGISGNFE